MPSIESKIVDVARNATFSHPLTRRSFFAAMGAAGITLGAVACGAGGSSTSTAAGGGAGAGKVQEKTLCQVTTLSNDYFVAFSDGGKQAMDTLGVSMSSVEDQATSTLRWDR